MELGKVIAVGVVEDPCCDRGRQRGEPLGVEQPPKQRGVFGQVDVASLDVQCGRAADVVQHRHDGRQLVALGQAGTAQRSEPCIQPCKLSRVCRRSRRGCLQDPRVVVVDVP
jgi:hypothetical protein